MSEKMHPQTRANLFMDVLERIPVGDTVRCTGLDDDELCSNLDQRSYYNNCMSCGAVSIVDLKLVNKEAEYVVVREGV